ncbi:vomeronasal type-2 receptor 116-like, partial [Varanus komodoensis]|uniref:vomeronasal type-2 receptor 116-like n=1 Tax=Varanus komodoensis TaxID=61221 RepID=UPI001CF791DF
MYQHILALSFAVDEINGNPQILPNLTLGFHILNGYYIARMRYKATMGLLCTYHRFVPNFSCGAQKKIAAVIGGLVTEASEILAIILAMYKIPQLHPFLRSISFNNSAGDLVSLDERGELAAGFDLINWVTFPNQSFLRVKVGGVDPQAVSGQEFTINKEAITWHRAFHQVLPIARCNDNCPSGSQRKKKEGHPFCCYVCTPCPTEMISDKKDMDDCSYCPEEEFPNSEQDHCIPKSLSFLSFSEPLGMTFTFLALSFALLTALVLAAFIKKRNTPIIK